MTWDYELAGMINRKPVKVSTEGAMIGVTVAVNPFKVQINNGQFLLDKSNAYVCSQLKERTSKFSFSSNDGEINGSYYSSLSAEDADIELDTVWNVGDKVLIVPSADGQRFFIVDKIWEG